MKLVDYFHYQLLSSSCCRPSLEQRKGELNYRIFNFEWIIYLNNYLHNLSIQALIKYAEISITSNTVSPETKCHDIRTSEDFIDVATTLDFSILYWLYSIPNNCESHVAELKYILFLFFYLFSPDWCQYGWITATCRKHHWISVCPDAWREQSVFSSLRSYTRRSTWAKHIAGSSSCLL